MIAFLKRILGINPTALETEPEPESAVIPEEKPTPVKRPLACFPSEHIVLQYLKLLPALLLVERMRAVYKMCSIVKDSDHETAYEFIKYADGIILDMVDAYNRQWAYQGGSNGFEGAFQYSKELTAAALEEYKFARYSAFTLR